MYVYLFHLFIFIYSYYGSVCLVICSYIYFLFFGFVFRIVLLLHTVNSETASQFLNIIRLIAFFHFSSFL